MNTKLRDNAEKIARILKTKIPNLECPACKQKNFVLADGYLAHDLQEDLVSRQMGGKNIPVVPIVCNNCGFIMEFSAGILGLLPANDKSEK